MKQEQNIENRKVVAYIRTGKDDNGEEQRQKITEFCEKENLELVRIISDIGVSGLDPNRKGLNEMLRFLEDKKNDVASVIVTDFSKLSRDMHHSPSITKFLFALQINIKNVAGNCISISNYYESASNMLMAKPDRGSENIKAGIKYAKNEGFFLGKTPLGYRKEKSQGRSILIVDNEKVELVRSIFKLYLSSRQFEQVEAEIHRSGAKELNDIAIVKILKNPVYAGFVKASDGNLIRGKHAPIISEGEFQSVQKKLKKEVLCKKKTKGKRF